MTERTVSVTYVAACALWSMTVVFILVGTAVGLLNGAGAMHPIVMSLMAYGLACSAAAATMSIRLEIRKQNKFLRDAFELGRDAQDSQVRRMR